MPRKFIQVLIQRKCIGNIKWQFKKSDWSDYVRKIKVLNSGDLTVMKLSYLEEVFFFKKTITGDMSWYIFWEEKI